MFEAQANLEMHWSQVIKELTELIRIETVAAQNKGAEEAIELLTSLFDAAGAQVELLSEHQGNPVLFVFFKAGEQGNDKRTLLFYNHYDVQPADPLDEWNTEPFVLTEKDGLLLGRGVGDNKGDIIARLTAIKLLKEELGYLPCNIKFLIEGEEEIGSPSLETCLRNHAARFSADACIWEFGNKDEDERPNIVAGLKGMAYFDLSIETSQADIHSSQGVIIDNAAWRLTHALSTIRDVEGNVLIPGFYDDVTQPTQVEKETASNLPFNSEDIKIRLGLKRPLLTEQTGEDPNIAKAFQPTINLCGFHSGYGGIGAKAVLPYKAQAKIDCRLVPGQDPTKIKELLRNHLNQQGFEDVQIKQLNGQYAYRSDPDHSFVRLVTETAAQIYKEAPLLIPTHPGSGPMYDLGHHLNLPIVSTGIGWIGSNYHAPNESVRKQDFVEGIAHISEIIKRFASEED